MSNTGSLTREQLAALEELAKTTDEALLQQALAQGIDIQALVTEQRARIYAKLAQAAQQHGTSPPPMPPGWTEPTKDTEHCIVD